MDKNKKNVLLQLISIVVGILSFISAVFYIKSNINEAIKQKKYQTKIKNIVQNSKKNKEKTTIDFKDLIDCEWDKMYVFEPYSSQEMMFESLGFKSSKILKSDISSRDEINLLVFTKDKKVITFIEYPRQYGDFSDLDSDVYGNENAVFELVYDENKPKIKEIFN